jgi:hypothetical protein
MATTGKWYYFNLLANSLNVTTDIDEELGAWAAAGEAYGEQVAEAKMNAHFSGFDGVPMADMPEPVRKPPIIAEVEAKAEEIMTWMEMMGEKYPAKETEGDDECPPF